MLNQFNASLWGDEAFSAVLSKNQPLEIIKIIIRDTSPPLYNLTLHFWYQIFGISEVSIRALSFTYFVITILFVYLIAKLLWGKKTGIISAILTFLNPFFFTYAFEGRMYSILALGVTSSTYFFLKLIKREEKKKKGSSLALVITYALSVDWALYSHHFAIFAVFLQALWMIFEFLFGNRGGAKKVFRGLVIAAILYLPWVYPLYRQTKMVTGGFWLGKPTLIDLRNLIYEYLAEGIKNPVVKLPFVNKTLGQIALYLIFAILILRKWHKEIKKSFFILSFFIFPIIITWAISQKMQSIFFNRYLLYTIPAAMILVSSNRRKISTPIIIAVIILFGIIDYNYFFHPTKKPFSELANYVKETKTKDDFLINWNSSAHHLWESKFYGLEAPIYNPSESLPYYVGTAQMTKDDVIKEIPNVKRIGVITSGSEDEIKIKNYSIDEVKKFGELKVVWLKKK